MQQKPEPHSNVGQRGGRIRGQGAFPGPCCLSQSQAPSGRHPHPLHPSWLSRHQNLWPHLSCLSPSPVLATQKETLCLPHSLPPDTLYSLSRVRSPPQLLWSDLLLLRGPGQISLPLRRLPWSHLIRNRLFFCVSVAFDTYLYVQHSSHFLQPFTLSLPPEAQLHKDSEPGHSSVCPRHSA